MPYFIGSRIWFIKITEGLTYVDASLYIGTDCKTIMEIPCAQV